VSGDDDVIGGDIKPPVTFVLGGVSEENTSAGPGCQFVSGFGGEIRMVGTTRTRTRAPWRVKYGLVMLITLLDRWFSTYVVVWSPSTQ
jgi:hypothetical protein